MPHFHVDAAERLPVGIKGLETQAGKLRRRVGQHEPQGLTRRLQVLLDEERRASPVPRATNDEAVPLVELHLDGEAAIRPGPRRL